MGVMSSCILFGFCSLLFSILYSKAESSIWIDLMDRVQTKYVYIGRNVIKFTWFDRLERLVREIGNLEASVVSGAYRTLVSGVVSTFSFISCLTNHQ